MLPFPVEILYYRTNADRDCVQNSVYVFVKKVKAVGIPKTINYLNHFPSFHCTESLLSSTFTSNGHYFWQSTLYTM